MTTMPIDNSNSTKVFVFVVFFHSLVPMQVDRKHDITVPAKYGIQPLDKRQFNLSTNTFELLIFEMALVIKHYVQFAFLFVHTVFSHIRDWSFFCFK